MPAQRRELLGYDHGVDDLVATHPDQVEGLPLDVTDASAIEAAVFDVCVFGPAALVRAVLPHMRARRSGEIVQRRPRRRYLAVRHARPLPSGGQRGRGDPARRAAPAAARGPCGVAPGAGLPDARTELLVIDETTTAREFENRVRANAAYYRLARGL
jgi:hypothetical protein